MQPILRRIYTKFNKWREGSLNVPLHPGIPAERIGTPYGGWIIPKDKLTAQSICYLVGAGEDVSFDLGIASKYSCQVHIFDPTPRAIAHVENLQKNLREGKKTACTTSPTGYYPDCPPETGNLLRLHPYGIWESDTQLRFYAPLKAEHVSHSLVNLQKSDQFIEVEVRRLSGVMRELGHQRLDLLKIDTEGAEYQILESILEDRLVVDILCIEYDESASNHLDRQYLGRIKKSLEALQHAGYVVIAKEPDSRNYTLLHRRRL